MRKIRKEELAEWSIKDSVMWEKIREQLKQDKEYRQKLLRKDKNEQTSVHRKLG